MSKITMDELSDSLKSYLNELENSGGGSGGSGGGAVTPSATSKDMAKKLARIQQIADMSDFEFEGENVYYDGFDGTNDQSLGQIDLTSFTITTNSAQIINTDDSESLAKLQPGQEITLIKDQLIERVIIQAVEENFLTIQTAITPGAFDGGTAARSMAMIHNGRLLLVPENAPEYDIRYKIIPKNKQASNLYTWIRYSNPSICNQYDAIITKDVEESFYYSGVEINNVRIDVDNFKLVFDCDIPEYATVKLFVAFNRAVSEKDYDIVEDVTYVGAGKNKIVEIPIEDIGVKINYTFVCYYEDGTANRSQVQSGSIELENCYRYSIRIHKQISDPSLAVEYLDTTTDINDWSAVEPFKSIRPVALNATTGEIVGELQEKDYTKFLDGTALPTTHDVMIEYPKVYWASRPSDTYIDIIISNKKIAPDMEAYAHHTGGVDKDFLYVGAYRAIRTGTDPNFVLRSYYNANAVASVTVNDFRQYAKNKGAGWGIMTWHTMSLIKILFILRYKTLNSQSICGRGYIKNTAAQSTAYATAGLTSGSSGLGGNDYRYAKLFGLGDIYGSGYTVLDGLFATSTYLRVSKDNLNPVDAYSNGPDIPVSLNEGSLTNGRIDDVQGVGGYLFYPKQITSATATTYYCDRADLNATAGLFVARTGAYADTNNLGLFGVSFSSPTTGAADIYARLIKL